MENNGEIFEPVNRYCPICGNFIKINSPIHRCLDIDLKKIEKEEKKKKLKTDRTFNDKISDFYEFYNSDNYYDNDIEEE